MAWLDAIWEHRKLSLALLWVLTIVGAAICGRLTAPKPQPAIHLTQQEDHEGTHNNDVQIQRVEGPVVIKEHTVTKTVPVPGSSVTCGSISVTDREEDHGQVVVDISDKSVSHETDHINTTLQITPTPNKPGWSVGISIGNPATDKLLRLDVGRRLFGNFWLQAGTTPAHGEWDIGLAYQF